MKKSTIRKREKQLLFLLKQAIDHTDDAVMITNAKLNYPGPKIIYVNPALCEMTGYTKKDFIGKSPRILQGPRTDHVLLANTNNNLLQGKPFHGEVINYRKDGSEMHMELDIAPIWGEKNKITHYISIQRDVTSSVKKEIEQYEMMGAFNHDIKTVLSTIKGYMQLLEKKSVDLKVIQYISNCKNELDKILHLAQEIKDSTSLKSNYATIQTQIIDMDAIIAQTIKNVKVNSKSHKIARRGKVHQQLQIDANRISQVVEYLINNAIRYSPHTDKVVVHAKKDTKKVIISVEGFGNGIPREELDNLFHRYYISNNTNNQPNNGQEHNMYLASEIVKAHGGAMDVQSTPGKGSVFSLTLPIENKQIHQQALTKPKELYQQLQNKKHFSEIN